MGHEDLFEAALEAVNAVESQMGSALSMAKKRDPEATQIGVGGNVTAFKKREADSCSLDDTVPKFMESDFLRDKSSPRLRETRNPLLETRNPHLETRNPHLETRNPHLETTNSEGIQSRLGKMRELEERVRQLQDEISLTRRQLDVCTRQLEKTTQEKKHAEEALAGDRKEKEELRANLEKEKAALEKEKKDSKQHAERVLRLTADFDNYRKRMARDQERMQQQAEEKIMMSFLPVMDNLERALMHSTQTEDKAQLLQGLKMTSKLFLSTLAKFGCMQFKSVGEEFNPAFHDVLQRIVDAESPHNTVVQEHLSGYLMNKRVLRPALVVVAQHPEPEEAKEEVSHSTEPAENAEAAETNEQAEAVESSEQAEAAETTAQAEASEQAEVAEEPEKAEEKSEESETTAEQNAEKAETENSENPKESDADPSDHETE